MAEASAPVAFVTGASRGIGKVCAVELARAGFRVAVTARTLSTADQRKLPGNLEETAAAIVDAGGEALALQLDLDDRTSIDAAVDAVLLAWGRIDLLLNNAFYQTW
jgi:3-oxoacyl-[acyl-carrier protein] reductase